MFNFSLTNETFNTWVIKGAVSWIASYFLSRTKTLENWTIIVLDFAKRFYDAENNA